MSTKFRTSLPPHVLTSDSPRIRTVLEQAEEQNGVITTVYAPVAAPGLLETSLTGHGRFRKESGFTPAEQEVLLLTISRGISGLCGVPAHGDVAEKSCASATVADATRDGAAVPDPKLRALSEFTDKLIAKRGRLDQEDVDALLAAGYTEQHIQEIMLAVGVEALAICCDQAFKAMVEDAFAPKKWSRTEVIGAWVLTPGR